MIPCALIGYGYWGKILRRYIEESAYFSLEAIATNDPIPNEPLSTTLEKALANSAIDAVFVATPLSTHFSICKDALEHNKHVFCEKPATETSIQFIQLIAIAQERGLIFYTDYLYTNSPSINYIKENLDIIGDIQGLSCSIEQFGKFYESESVFQTIGVHMLSAILHITDSTIQESCFRGFDFVEGTCVAGLSGIALKNGLNAAIFASLHSSSKVRKLTIFGSSGKYDFEMTRDSPLQLLKYGTKDNGQTVFARETFDFDESNTVSLAINDFEGCIKNNNALSNIRISSEIQRWLEESKQLSCGKH